MPYKDPEIGRQKKREYALAHSAEAVVRVREWRKRNPDAHRIQSRADHQRHREKRLSRGREHYYETLYKQKIRKLLVKYGLDAEAYEKLFEKQKGLCALCESNPGPGKLVVDHDHKTGRVRGLLCRPCNLAIAKAEANPNWFTKAQIYLLGDPSE
jgi:hypothetical protein